MIPAVLTAPDRVAPAASAVSADDATAFAGMLGLALRDPGEQTIEAPAVGVPAGEGAATDELDAALDAVLETGLSAMADDEPEVEVPPTSETDEVAGVPVEVEVEVEAPTTPRVEVEIRPETRVEAATLQQTERAGRPTVTSTTLAPARAGTVATDPAVAAEPTAPSPGPAPAPTPAGNAAAHTSTVGETPPASSEVATATEAPTGDTAEESVLGTRVDRSTTASTASAPTRPATPATTTPAATTTTPGAAEAAVDSTTTGRPAATTTTPTTPTPTTPAPTTTTPTPTTATPTTATPAPATPAVATPAPAGETAPVDQTVQVTTPAVAAHAAATSADAPSEPSTPAPAPIAAPHQPAPVAATAAPTAPPPPPAPPAPVAPQIIEHVTPLIAGGDGTHELTIELDPVDLGRLRLEITLDDGVVSIRLHADDAGTRRLLADSMSELRAALDDAGLTAGDLDVRDGATDPRGRDDAPHRSTGSSPADATTPVRPRTRPAGRSALDVLL